MKNISVFSDISKIKMADHSNPPLTYQYPNNINNDGEMDDVSKYNEFVSEVGQLFICFQRDSLQLFNKVTFISNTCKRHRFYYITQCQLFLIVEPIDYMEISFK